MIAYVYSYTLSQVILSTDQAACIVSDHGCDVQLQGYPSTPHTTAGGDVSLGKRQSTVCVSVNLK